MKNFLIAAALISNYGCGILMTVSEHNHLTEKRESEWLSAWKKLKKNNSELELRILSHEETLKEALKQLNLKKEFALALQKRNSKLLEEFKLLRKNNDLEKTKLQDEIDIQLDKINSLSKLILELKKDILRKENEYISLEKSKRKFKCQSWECFKDAVSGSDNFWDKYASQAEEFLGKTPHRRLLEKERKSVIRKWTRGYKSWRGVSRTYFDWVSGDRRKTFVAELGQTYGNEWDSLNDFELSGKIKIEIKTRKDQEFFDEVNSGAWKIVVNVKISKKIRKSCFWRNCTAEGVIIKTIKNIEFVPDKEQFKWDGNPKIKMFSSKKFIHVQ